MSPLKKFLADESGMETVEYAVFGALLMLAMVIGARALWGAVQTEFTEIANWILNPA